MLTPRLRRSLLLSLLPLGLAAAALALTPAAPPRLDVASSPGSQLVRGVAVDGQGVVTLVWSQLSEEGGSTVVMRRFSQTDAPLGPDAVLESAGSLPFGAAANQRGDYVIAWIRARPDGGSDVVVRKAGPGLAPVVVVANGPGAYYRYSGGVAIDQNGDFVAVWTASTPAGARVFGQRFNPDGSKRGPEFNAATDLTGSQSSPSVAMNPKTGEFVVVWTVSRKPGPSGRGIFGQRFGFLTGRQGKEFQVNTLPLGRVVVPQVKRAESGAFVAVWTSRRGEISSDTHGQRFDPQGRKVGSELVIREGGVSLPDSFARLAMAPKGNFVVVWEDALEDGFPSQEGAPVLMARSYLRDGTPLGDARDISPRPGRMISPEVAFGWDGRFVLGATDSSDALFDDRNGEAGFQRWVP
jgi:hypothetical protein